MTEVREAPRRPAETRPAAPPPNPPEPPQAAAATPEPPPEKPVRIVKPLQNGRLLLSIDADGPIGRIWTANVPDGTLLEDLLDPSFFNCKAQIMRTGDIIRVLHDCWKFEAEYTVQRTYVVGPGTTPTHVKVYQRLFIECQPPEPVSNPGDIHIKHHGPHYKYALFRVGDPNPIQWGFETEADAIRARMNMRSSRNPLPPKG